MRPKVRLVVLNFNGGTDVVRCVEHLAAVRWPADRLELVLVDNASTDGSADAAAAAVPGLRVIRSASNLGFPGNNLALTELHGIDHVGLVNSDAFVDPGFLDPLVDALGGDPRVGAACPKILLVDRYRVLEEEVPPGRTLDVDGAVAGPGWEVLDVLDGPRVVARGGPAVAYLPTTADDPSGVDLVANVGSELTTTWFGRDRGLHAPDRGQFDAPEEVFAWCGAAVLFRAAYLDDVGLFDERLFLYYEDLDLAWRGRSRGWRYRTAPSSVVRHRLGASSEVGSPLFRYHVERNRLVVLVEHAPVRVAVASPLRHLLATASYLWRDVIAPVLERRRPDLRLVRLRLRSFAGFLRLLPHALAVRRRIGHRATVPVGDRLMRPAGDLQHSAPA